MNILFVTKEIPYPPNSGGRIRTWNMIKQLAEKNRVILLCYGHKEEAIATEVKNVCHSIMFVSPLLNQPIKWLRYLRVLLGMVFILPLLIRDRYSPQMREAIDRLLDSEKIDMIICDTLYLAIHVPHNRCKTILNEHNIESTIFYRSAAFEKRLFRKIFTLIEFIKLKHYENEMWEKFDCVFVCSEVDRDAMIKRSKQANMDVIPNGVDLDLFSSNGKKENDNYVVFTGLINWKPNEDALKFFIKEIYPLIKEKIPQVHFWIVGKDPTEEIKRFSIEDHSITVTGMVDDVRPFVQESAVFVVPLRMGSGTRLKILEALAMGKAVVSTSIGCEGIKVKDDYDIVIGDNPVEFSANVIKLLEDKSKRSKLGRNGRRLVEQQYSWDKIGRLMDEKIYKVLERK